VHRIDTAMMRTTPTLRAATTTSHLEPIDDPDRNPETCPALFEPTGDRRPRRARDTAATPPDAPHCAEPSLWHLDMAAVSFFYEPY